MREAIRRAVERFPLLAWSYRAVRDAWRREHRRPVQTPHGFQMVGPSSVTSPTFETEEVALIKRLLSKVDVFVDVGANVGLYTCLARAAGRQVLSIEPLPENLDCLLENLETNGWSDVEVFPVGVAAQPGIATLYGAATGASLVDGWAGQSPLMRHRIALSTLDRILGHRFSTEQLLIKVDVEGAELRVLQGAPATLDRAPAPAWIVEINLTENHPDGTNPDFEAVFKLFWAHGYRAWHVERGRTPVSPDDVRAWAAAPATGPGAGNYFFAKSEGFAWD